MIWKNTPLIIIIWDIIKILPILAGIGGNTDMDGLPAVDLLMDWGAFSNGGSGDLGLGGLALKWISPGEDVRRLCVSVGILIVCGRGIEWDRTDGLLSVALRIVILDSGHFWLSASDLS